MIHREWLLFPAEVIALDSRPSSTCHWVLVCEVTDDEDGWLFAELFGWDPADKPTRAELDDCIDVWAGSVVTERIRALGYTGLEAPVVRQRD